MSQASVPLVSVIVATRPGRDGVGRAVRSVLENETAHAFEVCVVHLDGGETAEVLRPSLIDPRLRVMSTPARGSARGHNLAIPETSGDLLAFTDDDCEVSKDWIDQTVAAFERDENIGLVFGNVDRADPSAATSPSYVIGEERLARQVRDKAHVEGIWASMAMRRRTWAALGGFDECFGAGASFPGSADGDLALRVLAAGEWVLETPRVRVTHHRRLPSAQHRAAVDGYSYASGALLAKHLRIRPLEVAALSLVLAWRWARGRSHTALSLPTGRRRRWARVAAAIRGLLRGLVIPIDRRSGKFVAPHQAP